VSTDASYPVSDAGLPLVPISGPSPTGLTNPAAEGGAGFLGNGLLRPFRRDQKLDFANAAGLELVRSAVGQVLGTRAASDTIQGEIPWRTEFGSLLYLLRHRNNDITTRELARVYVAQAIARWEPRVRVTNVITQRQEVPPNGDVALSARVFFDVIDRNVPGNQVLLSGLDVTVPVE